MRRGSNCFIRCHKENKKDTLDIPINLMLPALLNKRVAGIYATKIIKIKKEIGDEIEANPRRAN